MRLTTEQILEKFPSMGKHDTIVGRYYGDVFYKECPLEPKYGNIDAVDSFVAKCYYPKKVYKYLFNHGYGYMTEDGHVIGGTINVKYKKNYPYQINLMNDHCGQYGFYIWVQNSGEPTVQSFFTKDYLKTDHLRKITTKEIDADTIEKLFQKVEKDDEYGMFAKELVKTAKNMLTNAE